MAHTPRTRLHAHRNRAIDLVVNVDTEVTAPALTDILFAFADTTIDNLTPTPGGNGILVDVTLTADDVDIEPGTYQWELSAIANNADRRSLADGLIDISYEPVPVAESP